jgi:hypothetical protein
MLITQGIAECMQCNVAIKIGAWPERIEDAKETEDILHEQENRAVSN